MRRLPIALFCALSGHGLLILLPCSKVAYIPPALPGQDTIKISLTSTVAVEPKTYATDTRQNENQDDSNLIQEKVQAIIPPEKTVRQPNIPGKQVAEPGQPKQTTPVPVFLQPQARKRQLQPATTAGRSPEGPINTQAFTNSVQTSTAPEKTSVDAPVLVKGSPLYHRNPKPPYPNLARRRGWQGTVVLAVTVSEKGSANQVAVHTSSGYELLDSAASDTVSTWHFLPGKKNGQPVTTKVLVPVHFKLE